MFKKIFKRQNKIEVLKKTEQFKKLVCEIDIKRYEQKEFEKIVNLLYQDIFRIE
tara:strand:- start:2286 stop:2447 length:162 start_codon:yes stop_codon:yes gene_type:complete